MNAKMTLDEEGLLTAEFDRRFCQETPEAIEWAFEAWREKSPFFPAVSDIIGLLKDFKRGQREQEELKARLDEKFLLEERRKQGQVPDFVDVLKQLKAVAEKAEPEHMQRMRKFDEKLDMKRVSLSAATLGLSPEQIQARRDKERAEIRRYGEIEDQRNGMY